MDVGTNLTNQFLKKFLDISEFLNYDTNQRPSSCMSTSVHIYEQYGKGKSMGKVKMKKSILLNGTFGVLITPFDEYGNIDQKSLEKELQFCLRGDSDGLLALGSTGEFPYTNHSQRELILQKSFEITSSRKILVAGASGLTEREVLNNLELIQRIGYEYAIICPPSYFPQGQKEVGEFFKNIAQEADESLKIILYNIPACTAEISIETFEELLEIDSIIGIKDSSGNGLFLSDILSLVEERRPEFSVLTGHDTQILPAIVQGASGVMSALSWILNKEIRTLVDLILAGQIREARFLQFMFNALVRHVNIIPFPENYRALASATGVFCGVAQREYSILKGEKYSQWTQKSQVLVQKIRDFVSDLDVEIRNVSS